MQSPLPEATKQAIHAELKLYFVSLYLCDLTAFSVPLHLIPHPLNGSGFGQ
jgi:hypothetical protein